MEYQRLAGAQAWRLDSFFPQNVRTPFQGAAIDQMRGPFFLACSLLVYP